MVFDSVLRRIPATAASYQRKVPVEPVDADNAMLPEPQVEPLVTVGEKELSIIVATTNLRALTQPPTVKLT